MSHDKYFYGKKLYVLLTPRYIYQKQKTESVYLILKIIMAFLVKQVFFKNFPDRNSKNDDVIKYAILIFFYETKDNMLMIMHAKFEVNSCCGWDFRQGGGGYHRHPMHNRVKKNIRAYRNTTPELQNQPFKILRHCYFFQILTISYPT